MLFGQVITLANTVQNGSKVKDKEFVVLTELLMVQLLKLDAIQADGEAKVQRRIEVSCCIDFMSLRDEMWLFDDFVNLLKGLGSSFYTRNSLRNPSNLIH